ncbi:MAG: hypothetical protein IKB65_05580 [Ruminiclostridium sp.]|nr:hypothetical protein [Ruminiclostridium sp.]
MKLDPQEIARYLGYGRTPMPLEVAALAEACEEELTGGITPRFLGRRMEAHRFTADSRDLAYHLRHCREVILYAITLGPQADLLLRRWSVRNMAKAAVGQAVCAAWLDQLAADYVEGLSLEEGEYLTPPFSPGYGDWALDNQKQVLDLLDAPRRLGLSLTQAGMLVPEKSITALVGVSDRPEESCGQKCMRCKKKDCPFRAGD